MNADEVLDVLSEQQDALNWLANDGRQHFADARLSVFRSDEHFAVFTEFPHFGYGAYEFSNWLGYARNCSLPGIFATQYSLPHAQLLEEVPDAPLWRMDKYIHWLGDRAAFSVSVKGERHDFRPSPEDYERAGIVFKDERSGPNSLKPAELLRFLAVHLDHPFFLSEEELRALIKPDASRPMSLFLQTHYWQHPEPIFDCAEEKDWVENIPCWQVLARAIASGDLSEWRAQDTSGFNTDWAGLERIYHEGNHGYGFD